MTTWEAIQAQAILTAGLTASHIRHYIVHHLLQPSSLKGRITMDLTVITTKLPEIIKFTKVAAKVLVDEGVPGDTPDAKAATLATWLEPGFNKAIEDLGCPTWAEGWFDKAFENIIKTAVENIEAA